MTLLITPVTMILWLIGGQVAKWARRYCVPTFAILAGLVRYLRDPKRNEHASKILVLIPLIGILSMGYGINSRLGKYLKKEWLIRLIYAIMISIPLWIYAFITPTVPLLNMVYVTAGLAGAFQIHAGKLGTVGTFDILIEDLVRSFVFGVSLTWLLL